MAARLVFSGFPFRFVHRLSLAILPRWLHYRLRAENKRDLIMWKGLSEPDGNG